VYVLLPLECLNRGESALVAEVTGDPHWTSRLAELGLRAGVRVTMLQPGSPCLLQIGAGRLSLRLSDHAQILVQPLTDLAFPTSEVA
jgi:Fe2+ transport system protein FeoA